MRDVNRSRTGGLLLCAVAVCALTVVTGCGDDSTTGAQGQASARGVDARKLLMQKDEEPGFTSGRTGLGSTAPFPLPPAGARALRRSGFISTAFQSIEATTAGSQHHSLQDRDEARGSG